MENPEVNRRIAQVETMPEIKEECASPPAEKIYVAVGKDLDQRQKALIFLLHIRPALRYFPSPIGKIPLNQARKDALEAYRKDEEKEINLCMNKYLDMCTIAKVKAGHLIIEREEENEDATAGESTLCSKACGRVVRHFHYRKSKNNRSPLPDWLRKRTEASISKPSPDYYSQSVSSPANFGSDLNNSNQNPSNFQQDYMSAVAENMDNLEITAAISEFCSELEAADRPQIDVDQAYDVEYEPAESREANTEEEVPKLQFTEALEAVVNANKELQNEIVRRRKAEAAAIISIHKKCQSLTRRRNEVEEEVQEMVEKLTSLGAKVNECSRERQEARREEIKAATCDFSNDFKLGEKDYGIMYRGEIRQIAVAVKILKENGFQFRRDFESEIDIFKDIRHPHLIRIVGACSEQDCIIYEYMSNGSLADHLSCKDASPPLPFYTRFRIAAGVCSALQYLHSFRPDPIIHGDLKPQNIFLDENYVSKISDFGLYSRLLPRDLYSESEPKGTFSYMDPVYLKNAKYSTKSDVYSLGIVILQLLTGKPAPGLVKEVEYALQSATFDKLLDPSAGDWPFVHANQLAYLALDCTHQETKKRPDLQPTVMKMLNQLSNMFAATNLGSLVESGQNLEEATEEIHVPSYFLCPIFQEAMQDPYIAADGFRYEKEAIQGWFDCGHDTSPMTNQKLVSKNMIANFSLRSAIRQWQERGDILNI
ncbi:U-box domain-containing protein 33-like [Cryptomeria japonica]|uniref:U-box domain-containing protein 33-like n=1 Tax=Cryptomeria japonica TaxID=3369 RepID=UPI0027DA5061|nr:U-box domain-containing protein 33-like [Cryptomeria japonica]